jgi:hypothetical protein
MNKELRSQKLAGQHGSVFAENTYLAFGIGLGPGVPARADLGLGPSLYGQVKARP